MSFAVAWKRAAALACATAAGRPSPLSTAAAYATCASYAAAAAATVAVPRRGLASTASSAAAAAHPAAAIAAASTTNQAANPVAWKYTPSYATRDALVSGGAGSRAHLTHTERWFVVDAQGQPAGRLANLLVQVLQGKHKPIYHHSTLCGDHIVVINTKHVALSGTKWLEKVYRRHSGRPGGMKEEIARDYHARRPTEIIRRAVKNMLPRNNLRKRYLNRLHLYVDTAHPHGANITGILRPPVIASNLHERQFARWTELELKKADIRTEYDLALFRKALATHDPIHSLTAERAAISKPAVAAAASLKPEAPPKANPVFADMKGVDELALGKSAPERLTELRTTLTKQLQAHMEKSGISASESASLAQSVLDELVSRRRAA
ncbi:ribosomal protein L13 [Capsaspora owczarzaki ATCC 30864]|uniref:Ribosomal protein L13 n=1 Tax=Capsaspora owczarzaki (strain ATCC 30864) TaxID=595528 RepID=A0A0D2VWB5_CAPO3|nr:ribosomal protein L13 [Capsaspora owczarzaki ATCC 30864]KJE95842.1 ribosomal protein L13 [Capsaspora owczarzaki ATCC 30864]|eukprot:XP_004344995.1 ribosomal protein L13 [Capsaspora owczarzaki ATCC 30864]